MISMSRLVVKSLCLSSSRKPPIRCIQKGRHLFSHCLFTTFFRCCVYLRSDKVKDEALGWFPPLYLPDECWFFFFFSGRFSCCFYSSLMLEYCVYVDIVSCILLRVYVRFRLISWWGISPTLVSYYVALVSPRVLFKPL